MKVEKVNLKSLRETVHQSGAYSALLCNDVTMYIMIHPSNEKNLLREFNETTYCGFSLSTNNRLHMFMGIRILWTESIDLNEIILTCKI